MMNMYQDKDYIYFSNSLIIHKGKSRQMRHIWVTCMNLDT